MSDCIFCKIINGEIPSHTIYEDDDFKVILDRFPAALGHTLIIPKKHADDIFQLDNETAGKLFQLAVKVAKSVKNYIKPDGLNLLQNNGEAASQTVMHFHLHLIPRFKGDKMRISWDNLDPSDDDFKKITENLREFIQDY